MMAGVVSFAFSLAPFERPLSLLAAGTKTRFCFALSKELGALYAVDPKKSTTEKVRRGESRKRKRCIRREEPKRKASSTVFFTSSNLTPSLARCPTLLLLSRNKKKQESTIGAAFLTKSMPDHGVKFEIW